LPFRYSVCWVKLSHSTTNSCLKKAAFWRLLRHLW
jgi:hypothetical protein